MPVPGPTGPLPEPLVVGTAVSIDSGATGNPFNLRVARGANGDGFAAWLAADGLRTNLWVNRYRGTTATWGNPTNIASSTEINDFDLAVDRSGNAVVVWHEIPAASLPPQFGRVMSGISLSWSANSVPPRSGCRYAPSKTIAARSFP